MQDWMDREEKNNINEGTGCCYILENISILPQHKMEFALKMMASVIDSYSEFDSQVFVDPDRDTQYLVLPLSAQVKHNTKLKSAGYKLYHIQGVGFVR